MHSVDRSRARAWLDPALDLGGDSMESHQGGLQWHAWQGSGVGDQWD